MMYFKFDDFFLKRLHMHFISFNKRKSYPRSALLYLRFMSMFLPLVKTYSDRHIIVSSNPKCIKNCFKKIVSKLLNFFCLAVVLDHFCDFLANINKKIKEIFRIKILVQKSLIEPTEQSI